MSQEGYADPVTNDGPGFHSITPVSERRNLALPVVRNQGWGNAHNSHRPPQRPDRARGLKTNAKDSDLELARSTTPTRPIPRRAPTPGSTSTALFDL